jgi:hypothetical protein
VKQIKIIITGDKFTMQRAGKTVEEGWVCIDPTRKPKVIDMQQGGLTSFNHVARNAPETATTRAGWCSLSQVESISLVAD